MLRFFCTISLCLVLLFLAASPAQAEDLGSNMRMMPPVDPASDTALACRDGTRVITWDGNSSIKCNDKIRVTNQSDFQIAGALIPGFSVQNGTVPVRAGGSCSTEGMIAYDKTSTIHQLVFCNASRIWTNGLNVPQCNAVNNFLAYENGAFVCRSVALLTCASGTYLTSTDGATFSCSAAPTPPDVVVPPTVVVPPPGPVTIPVSTTACLGRLCGGHGDGVAPPGSWWSYARATASKLCSEAGYRYGHLSFTHQFWGGAYAYYNSDTSKWEYGDNSCTSSCDRITSVTCTNDPAATLVTNPPPYTPPAPPADGGVPADGGAPSDGGGA